MKTMFMGLAALALLLVSCSQNEIFENAVPSNSIKFKNLNDRVSSRAANDNDENYGVYAVLNGGTPAATSWFMDNQQVDGTDNSYSPLKYWPTTGNIDFYAYAPYSSANISLTEVTWDALNPVFDVTYTVPAGADEDFTIVTPVKGAVQATGQVGLLFSHKLSKVGFTTELAQDLANDGFVLTLNSVTMKVAFNQGKNSLASSTADWTDLAGSNVSYAGGSSYMIMPQPAPGTEITLNVSITHNGADYLINKDLKVIVLQASDLANFVKGTQYIFKVAVGDTTSDVDDNPVFNVISFTSSMSPWASGNIDLTNP